jgi:phosphoserine phosphatase RsbU/P
VAGIVAKGVVLVVPLALGSSSGVWRAIDTVASLAIAVGGAYFLVQGLRAARRRLLWRVRRKLILSYIFIGAIPALLIVAFFLLGGFLLFSNFSSYILRVRLQELSERAYATADATALEVRLAGASDVRAILARRQRVLARETAAASIALVPTAAACDDARRDVPAGGRLRPVNTAGPWAHLDPPSDIPAWIGCDGYSGLLAVAPLQAPADATRMLVRAVAMARAVTPGFAVVVDVPVDSEVTGRLQSDTSVEFVAAEVQTGAEQHVLAGRPLPMTATPAAPAGGLPLSTISLLEFHDWASGEVGTLRASMHVSIRPIYARLSEAQGSVGGRSLGRGLFIGLLVVGVLLLLIQAAAVVMGMALARSITGSVHALFAGTVRVQQGDLTHRIAVTARDQLGALTESFNSMTGSIETLVLEVAEKKRLEEELRIAHDIQMSLLPPAPASLPGLSMTALCVPAREVGGDYYDFLPLDEHRLGLLIADVAGKGTSAALYMAELKGLVLSLSRTHRSPRDLLMAANRLIAEHLGVRSFITMSYAVLDLEARTLTYARAGHTPLLYLPGGGTCEDRHAQLLAPDGLVLGLKIDDRGLFDRLLEEQTLQIGAGDVFLFFTDGITEAMNAQDECFGEERLSRLVEEHAHLSCEELRERMLRDVEAFVGGVPQHDDMTMILLKFDSVLPPVVRPAVVTREDQATLPVLYS